MLSNPRAALLLQMPRQEIDSTPALYSNEYHVITFLRSQNGRTSFRDLYRKITNIIPRLSQFHYEEIKYFYKMKEYSIQMIPDVDIKIKSPILQNELLKMVSSPVTYLMNKPFPLFHDRNSLLWSKEEEELLKK